MDLDPVQKLRERLHIIEGLLIAVDNWAEISDLVQASDDPSTARVALGKPPWSFSEFQADHILVMPQARRTLLGRRQLRDERDRVRQQLEDRAGRPHA